VAAREAIEAIAKKDDGVYAGKGGRNRYLHPETIRASPVMAHSAIRQAPRALVRCWGLSGPVSYGLSRVVFRQHVVRNRPEAV